MHKSFVERLFPYPSKPLLPQHEEREETAFLGGQRQHLATSLGTVQRGITATSEPRSVTSSRRNSHSWQAPLSASLVHHDDPFLPIERAARALQGTIQALLDAQSASLGSRLAGGTKESSSNGSATPTQSAVSPVRQADGPRTIPIRQPTAKKVTLTAARKGLVRSMSDFAALRENEIQLLDAEVEVRVDALQQVDDLEQREKSLVKEIEAINHEDTSDAAAALRNEAKSVGEEIRELEHRLLELQVRHRYLLAQADQIENSKESKASSYKSALKIVHKETRGFLRRPPIQRPLADKASVSGLYSLTAERRTLQMAREQWTVEQETLQERRLQVEQERDALLAGGKMWADALQRIQAFERSLRSHTKLVAQSLADISYALPAPAYNLGGELDRIVQSLENDISRAESENWNLLICVLGAELQACLEARDMLGHVDGNDGSPSATNNDTLLEDPPNNLSANVEPAPIENRSPWNDPPSPSTSQTSNQSLKDTLAAFTRTSATASPSTRPQLTQKQVEHRYESEDDDPPPDFLLSR